MPDTTTHTESTLRRILASRMRELMHSTPLNSQVKVGALSGVAQSTIGRLLRGDVAATLDNVESIARAFEVSPVTLLADTATLCELAHILTSLPADESGKVLAYARFVQSGYHATRSHHDDNKPRAVSRITAPSAEVGDAIQRAAGEPVSAQHRTQETYGKHEGQPAGTIRRRKRTEGRD